MANSTKIAAPKGEKGYVNGLAGWMSGFGQFFDPFEDNPDLLWPNSVRTYTLMGREDARIASVLRAVGLPIRRTPWRIDPNGAIDEVVEFVAKELGLPIAGEDEDDTKARNGRLKDRFSWAKHLQQAMMSQKFGHAVFERTYKIGDDGLAHIDRVAPRPASTIAYWNMARNGDLVSIEQWPAGSFNGTGTFVVGPTGVGTASAGQMTADRLVVYLNEPEAGIPFGTSVLRPAFKHWKLKDKHMRIQAAAAERNGIGVPGFTASEAESEDPERLTEYQKLASGYRGGQSSGFGIPNGATFKLYGVEGNLPDLQQAINYHDLQMGIVVLAHFLNLDGKGGSYALASVQADTFIQAEEVIADDVRDTAQAGIVEDLVTVNWGVDEPVPMLVHDEIGSQQDATAAALNLLAMAGLITPDSKLESYIRQSSGLPTVDLEGRPAEADPDVPQDVTEKVKVAAHSRRLPRAQARAPKTKTKGHPTLWD